MKNDFIGIFKVLEPKEQAGFYKYIHCFYNSQKVVLTLFENVTSALPSDGALEAVHAASVGNKNRLNALADLKKWLLEFLALQEIQNNSTESKFLSLEALRKRGLHEACQQKAKQLRQEIDKQPSLDMRHLYWKSRLAHINYFNTAHSNYSEEHMDKLTQLHTDLDGFYMAAKLKYSAELYNRTHVLADEYEIGLLNEVLKHIQKGVSAHPIVTDLYLPLFEMTKDRSQTAYFELKSFLQHSEKHEPIERQAILMYLINFATHRFRNGDQIFIQECFELFQFGLNNALFTVSGNFPSESFLGIINIGCRLRQVNWLKDFVKNWSPYLLSSEKDDIVCFSIARIAFEEKQFEKVVDLLQRDNFKNFTLYLNTRLLLIRSYYELPKMHPLMSPCCNALYQYTYRNKSIGTDLKVSVLNFVKIFRQLIGGKPKKQLVKELQSKREPVICADWLLLKIEELKR